MKKIMYFALSCVLAISLTGCGSKTPEQGKIDPTGEVGQVETEEVGTGEVTKLTYFAWDLGTEEDPPIDRVMLEMYNEAHPEVEVEIVSVPEGTNYDSYMATLASSGQMPDVFMWASVPESIMNGWATDVSEYAKNDEEYNMINSVTREGGQANGKVYGIPKGMNYMGMFINKDIFEANNVAQLEYGYTMDELMNAIEKNTTSTTKGVDNFMIEGWYPAITNPDYGFFTFDGEQVHLDSEEFAKGMEYAEKATQNNWNMMNTSPLEFFGKEGWAWGHIGGIALQYEGTWNLAGLLDTTDFEYDYLGLPGGSTVLINDYIYVSESCQNKEAAYDFAKWMSYSIDGTLERFDLSENSEAYTYNSIPLITTNDQINEQFFKTVEAFPGFIKAYQAAAQNPELLIVEGHKEVPGYPIAIKGADTGVQGKKDDGSSYSMTHEELRAAIMRGEFKLSDYASKMNDLANLEFSAARELIQEATK